MDGKPFLKDAWSGHEPFKFWRAPTISPEWLKRECQIMCGWNVSSAIFRMTDYSLIGVVRVM